jgi:hypothetical protein
MSDDDIASYAIPDTTVKERPIGVPRKVARKRQHFTMVPGIWAERLTRARFIATYRVALHLLYQHWWQRGQSFTLSNGAIASVSRRMKWRALAELEQLGLVSIERRPRKSPIITILVAPSPHQS